MPNALLATLLLLGWFLIQFFLETDANILDSLHEQVDLRAGSRQSRGAVIPAHQYILIYIYIHLFLYLFITVV